MRVGPSLGRTLMPDDDRTGARVVVLGDGYWRRRFGADPQAVGRSITLDGERYVIVGVMPPGFTAPIDAQAWVPPHHVVPEHPLRPTEDATQNRGSHYLGVCARLKPGVTMSGALYVAFGGFSALMLLGRLFSQAAHPTAFIALAMLLCTLGALMGRRSLRLRYVLDQIFFLLRLVLR